VLGVFVVVVVVAVVVVVVVVVLMKCRNILFFKKYEAALRHSVAC
jgi:hypothetical protein